MKFYLPHQHFTADKPLDFRKPVCCRADELDLLIEAGRTAGYGFTEIKTVRRRDFIIRFEPVEAYRHNQPQSKCNS